MDMDPLNGRSNLAVDLNGPLLRSDMLFESFWSAIDFGWRTPLCVV